MKKIFITTVAVAISICGFSQNKNGKVKKEQHDTYQKHEKSNGTHHKEKYGKNDGNDDVYQHADGQQGKYAKNLPAKVRAAFRRDFPQAKEISWTKNRGSWTATFSNDLFKRSVTYSSNGQRA